MNYMITLSLSKAVSQLNVYHSLEQKCEYDDNDKIMIIMKIMDYNENNKLIESIWLTTVDCTYNYTHHGKVSKYVICTTTMYVVPISAGSYAFCAVLPMVSQVTPCLSCHRVVQSVLLTPYQANNNHGTIGRLPPSAH